MEEQMKKYLCTPAHPMYLNCFVCGIQNSRGMNTRFYTDGDGVRAIFTADETLSGYRNLIHGGIISTLLDGAIIWATYAAMGRLGVTAELTVRFLNPCPIDKECIIIGKMLKEMSRLWIAEGILIDKEGTLYAKAVGKVVPEQNKCRTNCNRK